VRKSVIDERRSEESAKEREGASEEEKNMFSFSSLFIYSLLLSVFSLLISPSRFHIASCGSVFDHTITVWDVKRPYVPYACSLGKMSLSLISSSSDVSFLFPLPKGHKDVCAGFLFHKNSADAILSVGKDSKVQKQDPPSLSSFLLLPFFSFSFCLMTFKTLIAQCVTFAPQVSLGTSQTNLLLLQVSPNTRDQY